MPQHDDNPYAGFPPTAGVNPAAFLEQIGLALSMMGARNPETAMRMYLGLSGLRQHQQRSQMEQQIKMREQAEIKRQQDLQRQLSQGLQGDLQPGQLGPPAPYNENEGYALATQIGPEMLNALRSLRPALEAQGRVPHPEQVKADIIQRNLDRQMAEASQRPLALGEKRTFAPSGMTVEQQYRMSPEEMGAMGARISQGMGQPPMPQAQTPTGAPAGVVSPQQKQNPQYVPTQTIKIDESGNLSVNIGQEVVKLQSQHLTRMNPQTGRAEIVQQIFNPVSGQMIGESVIGQAESKEMIMKAEIIARERYRLQPTDPRFGQVVQAVLANTGLSDRVQGEAMAALDREFMPRGGPATPPVAPSGQTSQTRSGGAQGLGMPSPTVATGQTPSYGDILEAAHQRDVRQTVQKTTASTTAEEQVRREEGRMPASIDLKVSALDSVGAGISTIRKTYNPQFVGKGFQIFNRQLQSEVAKQRALANQGKYESGTIQSVLLPGSIGGAIREYGGAISPEEVAFRRSVVDIQDILLRARSGAQINESEFVRLSGLAVKLLDEPAVFQAGLDRFEKAALTEKRNTLRGITESPKQHFQRAEKELGQFTQHSDSSPAAASPAPPGGIAPAMAQGAKAIAEQFTSGQMTRTQARKALLDLGVPGGVVNQFLDRLIGGKRRR